MKKLLILLCTLVLTASNTLTVYANNNISPSDESSVEWPKGPSVYAGSAILMDASTGLILYEKNSDAKQYPASTTKIMTTLVALENASLNEVVTFSHDAVFGLEAGSTHIARDEGEEMFMKDCLYAIMLASANDVSAAVAEHIGGSIEGFAELMNKKADEIGCTNTNFLNPHGLYNENHYTCAKDLALIAKTAYENETFQEIASTTYYEVPPTNKHTEPHGCPNHHKMRPNGEYAYEYWMGGKTGWTSKSKYSLVTYAKKDNTTLISVIMCDDSIPHEYQDTKALLDFGFKNYTSYKLSELGDTDIAETTVIPSIYSSLFGDTNTDIYIENQGILTLPNTVKLNDLTPKVTFIPNSSLSEGENIIGSISYEYGGKTVGRSQIICNKVAAPSVAQAVNTPLKTQVLTSESKGNKNLKPLIIVVILAVIGILYLIYYIIFERPRLKRRKAYYQRKKLRESFKNDLTDFKP